MNTDHFILNLKKRDKLQVEIGIPASSDQINETERKMGIKFPEQVKWFYEACNGLKVIEPAINIKPLSDLKIDKESKIDFAVFDNQHVLSFDAGQINEADQWNIINSETGFVVTRTMASFWSNKIFAWLDKRRTIWKVEHFCYRDRDGHHGRCQDTFRLKHIIYAAFFSSPFDACSLVGLSFTIAS